MMFSGKDFQFRAARTAELILLFTAGPVIFFVMEINPLMIMPSLYLITLISWILFRITPHTETSEFSFIKLYLYLPGFLLTAAALALFITVTLLISDPDSLFRIPLRHTSVWIVVMFLYPVFSALPQEFIYRRFFFARYADLFTEKELVFLSALLFGIMHIVFGHWFSVVLSTIGGFLFARTYLFSRSLLITTFEHSLYGIVIFTFGFDSYFYDGPALP